MIMVKKRVADLEGAQLDWAVAVAANEPLSVDAWQAATRPGTVPFVMIGLGSVDKRVYYPSSSWCHGGPIIERERIDIEWWQDSNDLSVGWDAVVHMSVTQRVRLDGPTPLIAAMRAFVASKLGDEVEVPA